MPHWIIRCGGSDGVYFKLCFSVLEDLAVEGVMLYGCDVFTPGYNVDDLIEASNKRIIEVGTLMPVDVCTAYTPALREKIGHLLSFLITDRRYVADDFSRENYMHYATNIARVNVFMPALLCTDTALLQQIDSEYEYDLTPDDFGAIIARLILGVPFVVDTSGSDFRTDYVNYSLALRFLSSLGVQFKSGNDKVEIDSLSLRNALQDKIALMAGRLEQLKTYIAGSNIVKGNSVEDMLAKSSQRSIRFKSTPNIANGPKGMPRELVIGTTFDPTTHYDENYYAEGAGLLFTRPDGSTEIYKGPSRCWDGFVQISKIIKNVENGKNGTYLSLGCGAGSDVKAFTDLDYDAYGVDLSEHAINWGREQFKFPENKLLCADFTSIQIQERPGFDNAFDVVATYDFLEHLWSADLKRLLYNMIRFVREGGLLFHNVCTISAHEKIFVANKGVAFTKENSGILCSGHISVLRWQNWIDLFLSVAKENEIDLQFDYEFHSKFCAAMAEDAQLSTVRSWSPKNILCFRRY